MAADITLIAVLEGASTVPRELTSREKEAIALSFELNGSREVGERMGISPQRVRTLRLHAYQKLRVGGPNALILAIRKLGWY
jgi:DNA-binding CsgD family transcriptional regulator